MSFDCALFKQLFPAAPQPLVDFLSAEAWDDDNYPDSCIQEIARNLDLSLMPIASSPSDTGSMLNYLVKNCPAVRSHPKGVCLLSSANLRFWAEPCIRDSLGGFTTGLTCLLSYAQSVCNPSVCLPLLKALHPRLPIKLWEERSWDSLKTPLYVLFEMILFFSLDSCYLELFLDIQKQHPSFWGNKNIAIQPIMDLFCMLKNGGRTTREPNFKQLLSAAIHRCPPAVWASKSTVKVMNFVASAGSQAGMEAWCADDFTDRPLRLFIKAADSVFERYDPSTESAQELLDIISLIDDLPRAVFESEIGAYELSPTVAVALLPWHKLTAASDSQLITHLASIIGKIPASNFLQVNNNMTALYIMLVSLISAPISLTSVYRHLASAEGWLHPVSVVKKNNTPLALLMKQGVSKEQSTERWDTIKSVIQRLGGSKCSESDQLTLLQLLLQYFEPLNSSQMGAEQLLSDLIKSPPLTKTIVDPTTLEATYSSLVGTEKLKPIYSSLIHLFLATPTASMRANITHLISLDADLLASPIIDNEDKARTMETLLDKLIAHPLATPSKKSASPNARQEVLDLLLVVIQSMPNQAWSDELGTHPVEKIRGLQVRAPRDKVLADIVDIANNRAIKAQQVIFKSMPKSRIVKHCPGQPNRARAGASAQPGSKPMHTVSAPPATAEKKGKVLKEKTAPKAAAPGVDPVPEMAIAPLDQAQASMQLLNEIKNTLYPIAQLDTQKLNDLKDLLAVCDSRMFTELLQPDWDVSWTPFVLLVFFYTYQYNKLTSDIQPLFMATLTHVIEQSVERMWLVGSRVAGQPTFDVMPLDLLMWSVIVEPKNLKKVALLLVALARLNQLGITPSVQKLLAQKTVDSIGGLFEELEGFPMEDQSVKEFRQPYATIKEQLFEKEGCAPLRTPGFFRVHTAAAASVPSDENRQTLNGN